MPLTKFLLEMRDENRWWVTSPEDAGISVVGSDPTDAVIKARHMADDLRRAREGMSEDFVFRDAPDQEPTTLTDGNPVTPDHRELTPSGQQKGYVVLSADERAKGFVRPVRQAYRHLKCGVVTTMGLAIAETYARDPHFYSGTFCCGCGVHLPVGEDGEFVWDGTDEKVGA